MQALHRPAKIRLLVSSISLMSPGPNEASLSHAQSKEFCKGPPFAPRFLALRIERMAAWGRQKRIPSPGIEVVTINYVGSLPTPAGKKRMPRQGFGLRAPSSNAYMKPNVVYNGAHVDPHGSNTSKTPLIMPVLFGATRQRQAQAFFTPNNAA